MIETDFKEIGGRGVACDMATELRWARLAHHHSGAFQRTIEEMRSQPRPRNLPLRERTEFL
jgi:hypothetical protein